jgi:hypothetical protein
MTPSDSTASHHTTAQIEWGLPEDRANIGEGMGEAVIDWFNDRMPKHAPSPDQMPKQAPSLDNPSVEGSFNTEFQAVEAAAEHMYALTQDSGEQVGAFVLKKDGQYQLGGLQQDTSAQNIGQGPFVRESESGLPEEIKGYRDAGFEVVSHIHTHPDSAPVTQDGPEITVPEGPSATDIQAWAALGLPNGYVVTGDGDVVKMTLPNSEQRTSPNPDEHIQLNTELDVDPTYDNYLPLNLWRLSAPDANGAIEVSPSLEPKSIHDLPDSGAE